MFFAVENVGSFEPDESHVTVFRQNLDSSLLVATTFSTYCHPSLVCTSSRRIVKAGLLVLFCSNRILFRR